VTWRKTFRAVDVGDGSDGRWAASAQARWPVAQGWLTAEARTAEGFERHMPEVVPVLERLAGQLDRPGGETFLTLAAVRPFFSGCTQIGGPGTLVRNYDFSPEEYDATIVLSHFLRPVLGM